MRIARSLRLTAAAALSSVVATIAFPGPLAGSALAAPKPRTPLPANITPSTTAALTGVKTMQFTWTPTSTATLTCSLDGGKAVNCPTGSPSYGPLADGTHTFNLKIGKTSTTRPNTYTYSWTIDTTPPAAPTVNPVASPTSNTTATITWTDNGTGIAGHLCALDAATPVSCTAFPPVSGLTEGSHTAYVYAVDLIGNRSAAGSVTWVVDLTAPGSPVFSTVPANPTKVTVGQFAWQDGDATSFSCKLDGNSVAPCNPAGTSTVALADGAHTFSVQGLDLAQNVGLPATYSWLVDTQAPPMPLITNGPPSLSDVGSANFVFGDSDTTASFLCSIDDSGNAAFTACQSPAGYSVADGSHVFYVKAVDAAGNVSATRSYGWSVDTTANVVSAPAFVSGPNAFTKVQAPAFTWLDLDAATDHDECSVDG